MITQLNDLNPSVAHLLKVGEEPTIIKPANGVCFGLHELYALLGCDMIEVCRTQQAGSQGRKWRDSILIIDEEGKMKNLPANSLASEWYSAPNDIIVGNAILCPSDYLQ